MLEWLRRKKEIPLTGAPAVRRQKTYSAAITVATRRESVFVLCQVYWCYTDQPYCIYLREGFIDTLLIGGVNSASMILVNWIYEISIFNG